MDRATYFSNVHLVNMVSMVFGPLLRRVAAGSEYEYLCKDAFDNHYLRNFEENSLYAIKDSHTMTLDEIILAVAIGIEDDKLVKPFTEEYLNARIRPFKKSYGETEQAKL